MKYIDLHCDTLMHTSVDKDPDALHKNNKWSVDFKRLSAGNASAQFFAIFLFDEPYMLKLGRQPMSDDEYIDDLINHLHHSIDNHSDKIAFARNFADYQNNQANNLISAFLTIEDGRSIDNQIDKVQMYYNKGICLITLTWNFENCIGYPNSTNHQEMQRGLKPFGFEVVEAMNHFGMLVDVSHLSDGGFFDVANTTKQPFIASHSNARTLSEHPRNLTDEMIKILANKGGVMGLNFAPQFLKYDNPNSESRIDDMVHHLNYIRNIGGEDILAIGSDFDGISGQLEIDSADKMPLLFQRLEQDGWTTGQLEKLAFANAERIINDVLK